MTHFNFIFPNHNSCLKGLCIVSQGLYSNTENREYQMAPYEQILWQ